MTTTLPPKKKDHSFSPYATLGMFLKKFVIVKLGRYTN